MVAALDVAISIPRNIAFILSIVECHAQEGAHARTLIVELCTGRATPQHLTWFIRCVPLHYL